MAITSIGSPYQIGGGYGNNGGVGPMISGFQNNIWGAPVGPGQGGGGTAAGWPQYVPNGANPNENGYFGQSMDPNAPLIGPDGTWNGQQILNAQNQLMAPGSPTANGGVECAQGALLGGAVMAGPQATAQLAQNLILNGNGNPDDQAALEQINQNLNSGTATHNDLSQLQQIMANNYNQGNGTDADGVQVMESDMAGRGGYQALPDLPNQPNITAMNGPQTQDMLNGLGPGQNVTLEVATDPGQPVGHFVEAGTDANGNPYIYDPYPASNQPNVVTPTDNPDSYQHYIDTSAGQATSGLPQSNIINGGVTSFPTDTNACGSGTVTIPEITIVGNPNAPSDDSTPADSSPAPAPAPDSSPAPVCNDNPAPVCTDDGDGGGD